MNKNKKILNLVVAFIFIFALSGCSLTTDAQKILSLKDGVTSINDKKFDKVLKRKRDKQNNLKKEEKWTLLFMVEEEKMIRDLSYKFYQEYNEGVFEDIYKAENTHYKVVQKFIRDYNLDDPTSKKGVGEFHNPQIQMIHDDLLEQGMENKTEAYKALVNALERDVNDLNENIEKTNKDGILFAYRNLRRSSKNHIRVLMDIVRKKGEKYEPQYLSEAKFNSIKNSSIDSGGWWPF
ncbi:MAG: DUF2202 domain-containing protein [Candidatus Magasanikbacteria bacterium]